jgi:hypothetical protein
MTITANNFAANKPPRPVGSHGFALLCSDNHHTHLYSHRTIASALGQVDSGRTRASRAVILSPDLPR